MKIENLDLPVIPVQRTCRVCAEVLENLTVLRKHMRMKHPGELNFPCRLCDITLPSRYKKKRHHRLAHKGLPYTPSFTCSICNKAFKNIDLYHDHLSLHEGIKRHICDVCGAEFSSFINLSNHRVLHGPRTNKIYSCPKCDSKFHSRSACAYHKYKVHDKKSWQCPICGKVLAKLDQNHLNIHRKERKFVCETCGKRFNCAQYLADHRASHGAVKPYKCYYCEKRFTQRTPRSVHIRKFHTKETRYECNTCNIRFVTKYLLKKHILTH